MLHRPPAGCRPVEQRRQLHRGSSPPAQFIHQKIRRRPRMHQALSQHHVLAAYIQRVTEENFLQTAEVVPVPRLDESADHRHFKRSNQIRQKNESILQDPQGMHGLPLVIVRDLSRHLPHPLLNLLSRNDDSQFLFRLTHKKASPISPSRSPRSSTRKTVIPNQEVTTPPFPLVPPTLLPPQPPIP